MSFEPPEPTTSLDPNLTERANVLGIATDYIGVDRQRHEASESALRAVCELLERGTADVEVESDFDVVVVIRGGTLLSGAGSLTRPVRVELELEDGTIIGPAQVASPGSLGELIALSEVPIGIHRLRWSSKPSIDHESTLLAAPRRFPLPERTTPGLALFVPTYSLWSEAESLPSFDSIGRLGLALRSTGFKTLATLPLYAPGLGDEFQSSPYSPLSRFHWNELMVPDRLLSAQPTPGALAADHVEWPTVLDARTGQLQSTAEGLSDRRRADFEAFLTKRPDVVDYGEFASRNDPGLRESHVVGQWLAEQALADLAAELESRQQLLALDLPVGAREDSYETATWPDLFVEGATIGAPPDRFFTEGQNWGLPPLSPTSSRADGHRTWAKLLRTACRFAGVLRIDHVMQVHRLWWIPPGHAADDGVYVHYPADELLAVAAIVAHQTGTTVVGENLGTVPDAIVDLMNDWGLIGMYEEGFTIHDWAGPQPKPLPGNKGVPKGLPTVPKDSWVGIRTHDMPAFATTAAQLDLDRYRDVLGQELGETVPPSGAAGSDDQYVGLHDAMVKRLCASDAYEVVIDLDDILGETAAHNVPGTVAETNWSRRTDDPVEALDRNPRIARTLAAAKRAQ